MLLIWGVTYGPQVFAADFYIDPINGSDQGDGSSVNPWHTFEQVLADGLIESRDWEDFPPNQSTALIPKNVGAPIQAGDTIWLRNGYHGEVYVRGYYNISDITVAAQAGHKAKLSKLDVIAAENWVFENLSISTSHTDNPVSSGNLLVIDDHNFFGPTAHVTLSDSELFTVSDSSSWNASDWINLSRSAINVGSDEVTISGNVIKNVRFGISVTGNNSLISRNLIDGFSADGIRGLGDGNVFEYNRVQNCFVSSSQGDSNHDDGFQSWSVGVGGVGTGAVRDVVLRGNVFINYTDPSNPLNAPMQGIGCFDGNFNNWVVENNVVIVDHWHGISFYGLHDSLIINNTLADISAGSPGPPWIKIEDSSQGESNNNVVRNNLATDYSLSGTNLTTDHNIEYSDANLHFVAPPFNLNLLSSSSAVDAGDATLAPLLDIIEYPRPVGSAHDIGAYELRSDLIFNDGFE